MGSVRGPASQDLMWGPLEHLPRSEGTQRPRAPTGRLPHLWKPEDFTLLFFLTLRKWYEMAAVTLVLPQPSPSCRSSAPTPPRLPSRPGPEVSGMRAEEMPRRPQHPQAARALVVLAGAVTARGQTPAALTRRSCQPQTLSNRARERALQLQPPSDRHPGSHGPQGKYFLKVTLWFWRDYLP